MMTRFRKPKHVAVYLIMFLTDGLNTTRVPHLKMLAQRIRMLKLRFIQHVVKRARNCWKLVLLVVVPALGHGLHNAAKGK